ncbi:membrane protein [Streptomyces albospinus]|uniref:Membrane protein n=1 Tax=Streptomyces albospinus TaxID=285515 RepID=A0ABQ2VH52_9ACTN|nr:chaplin [Streptomyces albospinus]GGU86447.1 membrane protein [Streptomyces albospinus]
MNTAKKAAMVLMAVGIATGMSTGAALANSGAQGAAVKSPGFASGNLAQMPIHMPINLCGNSINVVGVLNPTFGNTCINAEPEHHTEIRNYHHHERHHEARHDHEEDED